jgi:hypothetical protein
MLTPVMHDAAPGCRTDNQATLLSQLTLDAGVLRGIGFTW